MELPLLFDALSFAAHKHRDQRRKDVNASPYINHPIALASVLVTEAGIEDVAVICGALLHDTVEDTETTPEELEQVFGPQIRAIVMDVMDDKTLDKHLRKQRQIDHAAHACREAKLIKLADKICNLRDIASCPPADWPLERKQHYFDWAKAVVDQIRGAHSDLERLFDEAYTHRPES